MGVPSMPTTASTPPTPNTTSYSHDIHGSNNPSPATAPAASTSVPISSPNHATRVGRSRDDRNHRLTRNSQRLNSARPGSYRDQRLDFELNHPEHQQRTTHHK